MCGSGQRIGMERAITVKVQRIIRPVRTLGSSECFGAAPGSMIQQTFALPGGSGMCRRDGSTTTGSAWPLPPGSYFLSSEILFSAVHLGTGAMPLLTTNFFAGRADIKESPIFVRTYDYTKWLLEDTIKFPKSQRFVMAKRAEEAVLNFYDLLLLA